MQTDSDSDVNEEEEIGAKKVVYAKLCDKVPFGDVAGVLDKVTECPTGKEKKAKLIKLFDHYRNFYKKEYGTLDSSAPNAHGDSLYPLVRIVLPAEDRGRGAYGFKSFTLGKMFAKILGVYDKEEGKKLMKFKDPTETGSMAGDFAAIVATIFKQRFSANETREGSGPSVIELHELLDRISKQRGEKDNVNIEYQKNQVQKFVLKLKANEVKWLVRILLKQMRLGLSTAQIFQCVHPQAKELYEKNANLEYVCQKLNDQSVPLVAAEISLFSHCQPMLCARLNIIGDQFEANSQEVGTDATGKNKIYLPQSPFVIETKWDGERFQIHYDGRRFKYSSRKGHDFTKAFDETLTPRLKPQLSHGVESFILDGEMMAWHIRKRRFTTKGQNIDVKTMRKDNPNHIPVFVAYDILYFNGEVLTNKPLLVRMKILKEDVLRPKEDVVLVSEQKMVNSKEEVMEALNDAIDNLEEGIVVKDINSFYEPSKRSTSWLKIKPEYVDGSCPNDMDLLILGVYYSESVIRGGNYTHFLVGVIDDSSGKERIFYPVAKLGTGQLKNPDVNTLIQRIEDHLVRTEVSCVKYKGKKRPDLFIDPKKSVALQVKASEITFNDTLEAKYTLRFPIITKVRFDKPWNEVMTLNEFHQLRESFSGKLAMRTDGKDKKVSKWGGKPHSKGKGAQYPDSDDDDKKVTDEPKAGPSRLMRSSGSSAPNSSSNQRAFTSLKTQNAKLGAMGFGISTSQKKTVQDDIFKGKKFCVYGSSKWKTEMESEVKRYGGTITISPLKTGMFAIIGEKNTSLQVASALKHKIYNVLKPDWIRKCIEMKTECELSPEDFWFALPEMKELFKNTHDKFGDSYTKEVTREELKSLLTRMVNDNGDENESSSETDYESSGQKTPMMEEIFPDEKLRNKILKYSFLERTKIAFRGSINHALAAKIEFYGGKVASDETEAGVTHVVVINPTSPRKKFHTMAMVVKVQWLEESLLKKEIVEELPYVII